MSLTKVSGDLLESPLTIPSGSSIVIESGGTITNNGTASGFGGGKVLQVVQAVKTDIFAGAANGTEMSVTGMSATITPTSSSSKIMVSAVLNYCSVSTTYGAYFKRGTTVIGIPPTDGSRQLITSGLGFTGDGNQVETGVIEYLDSPATTSATTYQLFVNNDNTAYIYINRSDFNYNDNRGKKCISTVTLTEIGA
jgi:hypothetical protein